MRDFAKINQMRVVYTLPDMDRVSVRKNVVYKAVEAETLTMDIYYPHVMQPHTTLPAVILVHGGSQPEHVEHITESQQYISWGQLIAASGLIAVMFKHRSDDGYTKLVEAGSDVDDLVQYIRDNGASLAIAVNALCIWSFSSGPLYGLRTALRNTPAYIRCIVAYYGGMTLMNRKYFHFSADEETLVKEFSPIYHLGNEDAPKIAPLFITKAGKDRDFLNESIDEFVHLASERNIPITFMNHPTGEHGFDIFNDDARTCEIIKASLAFVHVHLQ